MRSLIGPLTGSKVTTKLISDLTRKFFLTYIDSMVVSPDRESDVFGASSHRARRWRLELLV
jgi:hypothetical protein